MSWYRRGIATNGIKKRWINGGKFCQTIKERLKGLIRDRRIIFELKKCIPDLFYISVNLFRNCSYKEFFEYKSYLF